MIAADDEVDYDFNVIKHQLAQEIAGKVKGSGLDPADVLNRTKKILGVA